MDSRGRRPCGIPIGGVVFVGGMHIKASANLKKDDDDEDRSSAAEKEKWHTVLP